MRRQPPQDSPGLLVGVKGLVVSGIVVGLSTAVPVGTALGLLRSGVSGCGLTLGIPPVSPVKACPNDWAVVLALTRPAY